MGLPGLPPEMLDDVLWFSRHLASALQATDSLPSALDTLRGLASPSQRAFLAPLQRGVERGERLSDLLLERGLPTLVWGMVKSGEAGARLAEALGLLADRLETEKAAPPPGDARLYAYSLALGRLAPMLILRVPILNALEVAADSVSPSEATDALKAVRAAVAGGATSTAEALARVAPDLPPLTIDMLRDGEEAGRLAAALPIVSDYLLDAAAQTAAKRKEAHHAA